MIEALNKFVNEEVSALPIVDDEGRLTNIYSKFDVINLAATKSYDDLEITLKEATQHKIFFDGVHHCKGNPTTDYFSPPIIQIYLSFFKIKADI